MHDDLIQALREGDWLSLIDSAGNPQTVELLQIVVQDSDDEVVRQAATGALGALAEMIIPGAVEALIALVETVQKSYARDIAAFHLIGSGDARAHQWLVSLLSQPHHNGHLAAVRALAEVGDVRAVDPLIAAINDSRMTTRHELVRVLGEFDDVRVVFPLLRLLYHTDARVVAAAKYALSTFDKKHAYGMLIEYLTHHDFTSRRQAAIALGEIGSKRAIKPLLRVAGGEKDSRVQQAIGDALLKLGCNQPAYSP